jgi:hypothetical protein
MTKSPALVTKLTRNVAGAVSLDGVAVALAVVVSAAAAAGRSRPHAEAKSTRATIEPDWERRTVIG